MWENFGVSTYSRNQSVVFWSVVVFGCMIIFALVFYAPFVAYVLNFVRATGHHPSNWNCTLLGLMMAIGSAILSNVIAVAVRRKVE
jgi:hypothetical protein